MVSAAGKRKRVHVQIRTGIPLEQDAVVTRTEVTRNLKRRVLTKSRKVSVPVDQDTSSQGPPSRTPESEPLVPDPEPPTHKPQKGPSRSVSVRLSVSFNSPLWVSNGFLYRLTSKSGRSGIEKNSLTNSCFSKVWDPALKLVRHVA